MSMLICVFRQLSLAKTDSQTKNRKDKSPSKPHTQTRLSHRIILTDTFYLTRRRKCRHKHIRSIIARQISRCVDDWLKSSEFTFHITCEKKIQMNISRPRRKPMHNQLTRPLYTFVWCGRMQCVHNRIAIIIGSLVLCAFVIGRLRPLSIIIHLGVDLDYNE